MILIYRSMLAFSLMFYAFSAFSDTITLRADTWCPYNCDPKSSHPGYMIEIAKMALEPKGYKVDYQTLNWARAVSDTRDGKFSGIVGAAKTDAPDFLYPENSLGHAANCFYVKTDSPWKFVDEKSLANASIGVIKDYTYGEPIDSYIKANSSNSKKVDIVSGDKPLELNLKKLDNGRITAFIEEASVLKNYFFARHLSVNVKNVGCVFQSELYVGFGPKTPNASNLAQLISHKVESMRKDGSLKKLLEQYGISDWVK
jgi:polar amino acid transport system substrate-binding protein